MDKKGSSNLERRFDRRSLKFPKEKHNVAMTLLKAATRLEKSSPEDCIALQRRAIALMALEVKQARYAAYAAEKALEEVVRPE